MDMTYDNRRVILVDSNQEPYLSQGEIIAKIPVRSETTGQILLKLGTKIHW